MKHKLLSLALATSAIPLLAGCAAAAGSLNTAGNWLEGRDNSVAKSVGGFYKDLGSSIASTPAAKPDDKKAEKKQ